MDGTGKLFDPLLDALPPSIEREVIALSRLRSKGFESQASEIAQYIGEQEVVIFAESYSGPIAFHLSQIKGLNIRHIIFAASLLSRPSYISKWGFLAPFTVLRLKLVPSFILSWLFFGNLQRRDLVNLFYQSLEMVTDQTLKDRLKRIASLSNPKDPIVVPCIYIQATKDKLVNPNSVFVFQKLCADLKIKQVDGGHFIAQSNPKKCAEIVTEVLY